MGCCCRVCLKCGHLFCGCIPLRFASFVSCFCLFVTSCCETMGELYLIKPMLEGQNNDHLNVYLFMSAKVIQLCIVSLEMVMTFAVWKEYAQILQSATVLYAVFKGIKLLLSVIESISEGGGYSFIVTSCASAVIVLLPIIWNYQRRLKENRSETTAEGTGTAENQGDKSSTTKNKISSEIKI